MVLVGLADKKNDNLYDGGVCNNVVVNSSSADPTISTILLSNKVLLCVTQMFICPTDVGQHCWTTNVGQHLFVVCLQLKREM